MSPTDLTDEVRDTLTELRNRGYKLSIGSSSKNTKFILGQIGLGDFFDAIADGTDITHSKPDPEVFLIYAKKIGIDPADCAVVEDVKGYDLTSFSDLLNILPDALESIRAVPCRGHSAEQNRILLPQIHLSCLP